MSPNWKALAPHRPLGPGEPGYVAPPSRFAERVARLVASGTSTILVAGPVGVGKSTELAHAATLLQPTRVACLVQIDRYENVRRLTAEQLLLRLAGGLVALAVGSLGLVVSADLVVSLVRAGVLSPNLVGGRESGAGNFSASAETLLRAAVSEVGRHTRQGRISFLVDGLEKLPESPASHEILAAFGQVAEEVDLVVVVPWFAAFGGGDDVVRPGAHLAPLPACEVEGQDGERGRRFLIELLAHRLGADPGAFAPSSPAIAVFQDAARWSGGVPRTFLQLIADAAQYAEIRRGDAYPDPQDLADAIADQKDSFRRALMPGDTAALRRADGTDGREMDLGRKIRLLARGIILERQRGDEMVFDVHPIARPLLGGSSDA